MASLEDLIAAELLSDLDIELADTELPSARIVCFRRCEDWLVNTLPDLHTFALGGQMTPEEQAYNLFHRFITCAPLNYPGDFKHMHPHDQDVWELRTDDVRVYGWFFKPCVFIGVAANSTETVHRYDLDGGYVGEVIREREHLDLDEPKVCELAAIKDAWNIEE